MTQKATQQQSSSSSPLVPVVLFGVDQNGKPKAARFIEKHAELATKAAEHLNLQVLQVTAPAIAELVGRLPVGKIHANGRGFVPYIRRDLYAKLVAAAGAPAQSRQPLSQVVASTGSPKPGSQPNGQSTFPKDWGDISQGHVVIAQDTPEEGWYEALVVEKNGDLLTMQWLDYPRERRITRHRSTVGLLYPYDSPNIKTSPKTVQNSKPKTGEKSPAEEPKSVYPNTWQDIDVDSLVLAKDDGPWRSWWEAIVVAKTEQSLTLRWRETNQMLALRVRNFAQIPAITRPLWGVGLLYPNGR
jgi:hypothetical protein